MTDDERNYWVFFSAFPGIGPLRFKLLHEYFGSAKKAWQAPREDLLKVGLGEKLTAKLIHFRSKEAALTYRYIEILKKKNIKTIILLDREYPKLLREIPDAPFVLYARGNLDSIEDIGKSIAVVGTRKVTAYGRQVTRRITQDLVGAGLTIVSGMAYGVDAVAHETAISCGGKTIAVLGCGVDIIYPKENANLYWQIVKGKGLVVSEFPCGQLVTRGLFPSRNRIISGLSLGVVVTEGAKDSGALITARYAAEQGREVFAVPGPITSSFSKAPTILLKQGAKIAAEVEDILEELDIKSQKLKGKSTIQKSKIITSKEEEIVIKLLESENLHFDEIVRRSKIGTSKVGSLLTVMEVKKIVKNLGGGIYGIENA